MYGVEGPEHHVFEADCQHAEPRGRPEACFNFFASACPRPQPFTAVAPRCRNIFSYCIRILSQEPGDPRSGSFLRTSQDG